MAVVAECPDLYEDYAQGEGVALIKISLRILKTQGFEALEAQTEPNCPILAQARWFMQNDPAKLSTCWSLNYTGFVLGYFWRWDGESPRRKIPIFIDRFHVAQWVKWGLRRGGEKKQAKMFLGWL